MNKSNFDNRINQFIENNPKQSLQLLFIAICLVWMSGAALFGLVLYLIFSRVFTLQWWITLAIGALFALEAIFLNTGNGISIKSYLLNGFTVNLGFWKLVFIKTDFTPILYLLHYAGSYLFGFPVLIAGIFSMIDLIAENPHKPVIDAIQKGEHYQERTELSERKINKAMRQLKYTEANGVLLGVSTYTAKPVVLPDHYINQILLVLGTTGSGKSVTLQRFYDRAIKQGHPLIVIDGKPTQSNISWLRNLANHYGKRFYGFNCENYSHYDPLSNGDCSELKDKIISLKDHWESDYYRSIAEDYLQTTFEVLLQSGKPFDLKQVVKCLDFETLKDFCRSLRNSELLAQVESLQKYEMKDITGLQAHLKILVNSAMGKYFEPADNMFTLEEVIKDDSLVYFSLPALRYPSFSKVLGKLVINDIKATIERHKNNQRIFMVFDEFSVFAGDQVLNLVNMGRGKGVHAVFGTQGIADLNTVSDNFKSQMLNCANTIICHRLNDQESAEAVAGWMGTKDTFNVTAQYDANKTGASLGSVRPDKTYVIHPESIKQGLGTGEAYVVSKVGKFGWDKVRVMWS